MLEKLGRNWWLFLVRGILALLFGVFVIARPGAALMALVLVFGIYALADGIIALGYSFSPNTLHRWALAFAGILGIAVGYITLRNPGITAIALYTWIAFWAILVGIATVAYAIRLRKVIEHEGLMIAWGLVQVAFGVLLLALPMAGVMTLVWLIALYAFTAGILSISLSLKLHRLRGVRPPVTTTGMPLTQP
jgi:uncharacterized membrane protein HdeD (DUF308 family)